MSDLRIQCDEEMVGAGHPTKEDTLNRLMLAEHDSAGLHRRATLVVQETDPDTAAGQAALYVKESGGLAELFFRGAEGGTVNQLTQDGAVGSGQLGFIQGLIPFYVDGTNLGLGGGCLDIAGRCYALGSTLDSLDASSLSGHTWYYLEAAAPAGGGELAAGDFSLSASAPSFSPARGYWEREDKRCLFAFKTASDGAVAQFFCDGRHVFRASPVAFLSTSSPATSNTALSVGLPSLGELFFFGSLYVSLNNAQSYRVYLGPYGSDPGSNGYLVHEGYAPASYARRFVMFTDSQQQVAYKTVWNGNGSLTLYLHGYAMPAGMAR